MCMIYKYYLKTLAMWQQLHETEELLPKPIQDFYCYYRSPNNLERNIFSENSWRKKY